MFSICFIPELDLVSSRQNKKLAALVSPLPDPQAVAVDALSIPWDRPWVYAYPPTLLMPRVVHTLVHSSQCRMLLVAPLQHYQLWFPMKLRLLVDFPRDVPPLPRLVRQPQSGHACESDRFLKQLPTISARQIEHLPPASMTVSGEFVS